MREAQEHGVSSLLNGAAPAAVTQDLLEPMVVALFPTGRGGLPYPPNGAEAHLPPDRNEVPECPQECSCPVAMTKRGPWRTPTVPYDG